MNIDKLNSFDAKVRKETLEKLSWEVMNGVPLKNVNMHFHSSFSYNSENWSPSRIALEAKLSGIYAVGLCDFDVLDGLDEFLNACELLGVRATVNLETRAFLKEFAHADINSPGEAGVTYIMGAGFTKTPEKGTAQAEGLNNLKNGAKERNISLIKRINAKLAEIAIDYDKDVLPLTPSGTATERHIVTAYINKATSVFQAKSDLINFWSGIFSKSASETEALIDNMPKLEDIVRAKLAKRGGIAYVQPTENTFPSADNFIDWVSSCGAIPMITWLDGTSEGESDPKAMLECLISKGAGALNIIPDRNWNISDAADKAVKVAKLAEIVEVADAMDLPINIGTEMNKSGQPFVDELDGEILSKHKKSFLKGAKIMVGHSLLANFADFPYRGDKAFANFADIKEMNRFFEAVGGLPPITKIAAEKLRKLSPDNAFANFANLINK